VRAFAEAYHEEQFVQQVVGQIPWGHNVRLLDLVKDQEERLWYAQQTIESDGGCCARVLRRLGDNCASTCCTNHNDCVDNVLAVCSQKCEHREEEVLCQ
jgi:hypothetical protein